MKKGNEYILKIEKTEFPGYGIAYYNDKKVYVRNALPGQVIRGRIIKKKSSYIEANIQEIVEDINYRIENKCPHFSVCGGCTHQHISYEKQLELKKNQVLDLLQQGGISGFEFLGIEGSPEEFGYRNKMEFTFGDYEKGGELTLGMHMRGKTFGILSVNNCEIVDVDFREILKEVLEYFKGKALSYYRILSHTGYLRNLVVRKGKNTGEILINIVTTSQLDFDLSEITNKLKNMKYSGSLKGIIHTINDSLSDVVQADRINILYGQNFITDRLLGLTFKITPFSFFQTNSKGAEKLYSIVREFMEQSDEKVVFDLYCGTGTIGQIVAPKAKKVIGVELIQEAVVSANENAKLNGLDNCKFIAGDVSKVIKDINEKPDIIILDPPRSGVHPTALGYVMNFDAPDLIYVSCNPKSLVNDLQQIMKNGYNIEKIKLMDMFPHTPHIECVVKIRREKSV